MPKRKNILFTEQMEADAARVKVHFGLTTLSAAVRWALHSEVLRLDTRDRIIPAQHKNDDKEEPRK